MRSFFRRPHPTPPSLPLPLPSTLHTVASYLLPTHAILLPKSPRSPLPSPLSPISCSSTAPDGSPLCRLTGAAVSPVTPGLLRPASSYLGGLGPYAGGGGAMPASRAEGVSAPVAVARVVREWRREER